MVAIDPRHSLELLEPEMIRLNVAIRALSDQEWEQASSCQGWTAGDLVAHVVRNGWSLLEYVKRGLAGDPTPSFGPHVMAVQEEIKAGGARAAGERQQAEFQEFRRLFASLSEAQLAMMHTGHPMGPRPLGWASTQRLVEVAYHRWDLGSSFRQLGPLDDSVASYLLGFILQPGGRPPIALKPLPASAAGTIRLRATTDDSSWRLTASGGGLRVEQEPAGDADAEVAAEAGWLSLAIYGRASLDGNAFQVSGSPDTIATFKAVFG